MIVFSDSTFIISLRTAYQRVAPENMLPNIIQYLQKSLINEERLHIM